jgi:hypothetical protein
MKRRLRKIFKCDQAIYVRAKERADEEGVLFQRFVERAVEQGVKEESRRRPQRLTHDLMFKCESAVYEKAKARAHSEGVYLARWLERQLEAYMKLPDA